MNKHYLYFTKTRIYLVERLDEKRIAHVKTIWYANNTFAIPPRMWIDELIKGPVSHDISTEEVMQQYPEYFI